MPLFGKKKKKDKKEDDEQKKSETTTQTFSDANGKFTHITTTTTTEKTIIRTISQGGGSLRLPEPKKRPPLPAGSSSKVLERRSDSREYRLPTAQNAIAKDATAFQPLDPQRYGIKPYLSPYAPRARSASVSAAPLIARPSPSASNVSIPETLRDEQLVIRVRRCILPKRPSPHDKLEHYATTSRNRGYAFIINNVNYKETTHFRHGADVDEANLAELFRQMAFKTERFRDKKASDMLKLLTQHSKNSSLRKYDVHIVIVMGHGHGTAAGNSSILGTDGKPIAIHAILEQFNSKNCLFLKDKPKIFVFQCCRGDRQQVVQHDSVPFVSPSRDYGDMLIAYSTIPGYVSYRAPSSGSWYIQLLCKVFMEHACDTDVESMLKIVDRQLKDKDATGCRQTSNYENRGFHKLCYINPGA